MDLHILVMDRSLTERHTLGLYVSRALGVVPLLLCAAGLLVLLLGSRPAGAAPLTGPERSAPPLVSDMALRVLSSPPEWVSGGDARVEVRVPLEVPLGAVTVQAGTTDVTRALSADEEKHRLEGVIGDLPLGETRLVAHGEGHRASIVVTNHPRSGPMFSGAHQEPFMCTPREARAEIGLGEVDLGEHCDMDPQVGFVYRSSETGAFKPFDPRAERPDDLAQTTTMGGETVDFIVRWERGTINRFLYSIALLSPESQRTERADLSAWNRRLIYQFQGGVGIGHAQGTPDREEMLQPYGLSNGYAVLYSTGTRTGVHYDLEVGGETALMVKDRFVTAYDDPMYTVGVGGSGGGIQQYVYGQNHPSLLDAAIPQYSYPDMVTQTIHVGDCELLERYMDAKVEEDPDSKWATWENRTWLEGMNASNTLPNPYREDRPGLTECVNGWRGLMPLTLNPHYGDAPGMAPAVRDTVEWTHYADLVQIYGRADDGYAARSWDNVGVQYGLQALRRGQISPAEFLDLNAEVGGWKNEPEMVQAGRPFVEQADAFDPVSARNMMLSPGGGAPAPRSEADPGAVEAIRASGMVFSGDLDMPVIDWRHYLEDELNMHNAHQSFVSRARMLRHDGNASNHVVWFTDVDDPDERFDQTPMAFEVIDEWMMNMRAHPERGVAGNKPNRAVDRCFDAEGDVIYAGEDAWAGILDNKPKGACTQRFPLYSTARVAAGAPLEGDVFTCSVQSVGEAISTGVYGAWSPTSEQRARLEEIFPTGVCAYSAGQNSPANGPDPADP